MNQPTHGFTAMLLVARKSLVEMLRELQLLALTLLMPLLFLLIAKAMYVNEGQSNYHTCSMRQNGAMELRFMIYAFRMASLSPEARRDPVLGDALKAAFADARGKAATLAGEAGASLGPVQRIEESPGVQPMPLFAARASSDSATPIEPGTTEVQANVTVTFSLS